MGKALLSLSLLFLLPSLLFGSVWSSNALGQRIMEKEKLENSGWERVDDKDTTIILFNGQEEKRRVEYPDGYEEIVENERTRVYIDEEGRIERKIISFPDRIEEYNYNYSPFLSSYTFSVDSVIVERVEYLRTTDGSLLGLKREENPVFFSPEKVVYTLDGETETLLLEKVEEKDEIEWKDDGGYEEKTRENGVFVVNVYDGNGRLEEKRGEDYTIFYYYSENGALEESVKENSEGRESTRYEEGKSVLTTYYSPLGAILKTRKPLGDGTFEETRYIDGVPRYVFHLDRDGERILEARGL